MKIYKVAQVLTLLIICASCQKSTDSANAVENLDSSSLSLIPSNCQPGTSGVSVAEAKILGAENLVADQKTSLSLDSNVNCNQADKAHWSIGNMSLGRGSQIQTTLKGTGIYYINVNSAVDAESSNDKKSHSKSKITSVSANSVRVAVTDSKVLLIGSQVGVEFNSYDFSLVVPAGITLKAANWNFGNGSPLLHSLTSESRSFSVGVHNFSVEVIDSNDKSTTLQHTITILPLSAGLDCSAEELATLEIAGPTQVPMSEAMDYSLNQPACIKASIAKLSWNFGDATALASTDQVEHIYTKVGDYKISVGVWLDDAESATFTVTRYVNVIDTMEEFPGPPPPVDPRKCLLAGSKRTIDGELSEKDVACGLNGTRHNSYRDQIIEICQMKETALLWVEESRAQILVTEGPCSNQSCDVETSSGHQIVADGQSLTLYTNNSPVLNCASVQEIRICHNGEMTGSAQAKFTSCQNGCGDFGINGTAKVGVVVGEVQSNVSCTYGEQGVFDVFNQISDKTCIDGNIISSNTRQGELKTKGLCPTYSWVPTEQFSQCSADCGGTQKRIFSCRDQSGLSSDEIRCGSASGYQADERLCDGNPEAVRQTTSTSKNEEANSSTVCPKNQIGVIVNDRTVTTSITVACIDHKVQQESRVETATPWVTTSYCRDLVPMRCSNDSLSNEGATGRYKWMLRCQDQVPVIKEFLTKFDDVSYKGINIDDSTRHLYPTFLDSSTNKTWIAPKVASGSCNVPATVYVAAVCVSSCSTPEQEILAQITSQQGLKKVSFVEALTKKLTYVGTLKSNSSMQSVQLDKTEVDNWVTELLDTTQPILTFTMKSGGVLRVTPNHPLLAQDGTMKLARDFKVNDNLVQLGGHQDKVASIQSSDYYGKVYNLFVKSNELKKNIVVINGYLSGTAFYQNEGAQSMNRQIFRGNLIRGVFDK